MDVAIQVSRFFEDNRVFPVTHLHGVAVFVRRGSIVLIDLVLSLFVHLDNKDVIQ